MQESQNIKVLLVDDEEDFLADVSRKLSQEYDVKTARSGAEALGIVTAAHNQPMVLLSDQKMPNMTGLELFDEVLKRKILHLGRILFTGYGDTTMAVDAFNQGLIDNYVEKPFTPDKLDLLTSYVNLAADEAKHHINLERNVLNLKGAILSMGKEATMGRLIDGVLDFFRGTIHDIMTRESIMKGMAAKIRGAVGPHKASAEVTKYLDKIDFVVASNHKTFTKIINFFESTKSFSSAEMREKTGYPLHDIILSAISSLETVRIDKDVQIDTRFKAKNTFIQCVPSDLYSIFVNVLLRATDVTAKSGRIAVESEDLAGRVRVIVKDTGPALTADQQTKLFEEIPENKDYDVSLARKIVEKYSGTMSAQRSPKGETKIVVELPEGK